MATNTATPGTARTGVYGPKESPPQPERSDGPNNSSFASEPERRAHGSALPAGAHQAPPIDLEDPGPGSDYATVAATDKPPPWSERAEQSLLGALLASRAAWSDVAESVAVEDFFLHAHLTLARTVADMADRGEPCDLVTVAEALERAGKLDEAGGLPYLGRLADAAGAGANVGAYAHAIHRAAVERRAMAIGACLAQGPNGCDVADLLETARAELAALAADAGTPQTKLKPIPMDSLMTRRAPTRYAVDPYLPLDLTTLLGGHGGTGKTYLALTFAAHVACGREFAGHVVYCGRALYVSLEDDEDMVLDRLRRIVLAYGLDPETVQANVTILTGTLGDCAMAIEGGFGKRIAATRLVDEVKAAAAGHSLVVIDNASDAFAGNENDRGQVRGFMRMLAGIARSASAAVLLLAHIDKASAKFGSNNNSYSGSTAWHNSARSRLALTQSSDAGGISLDQEKLNVGMKAAPLALAWTDDAVLVPTGFPGASAPQEDTDAATQDAEAVLGALRAANAAGANVPPGRTGPSTAHKVLETFDQLPKALRGARGKDRFWAALNNLMGRGLIEAEVYKTHHRKDAQRLRVCQGCANPKGCDSGMRANPLRAPLPPIPPSGIGAGMRPTAGDGIGAALAQIGALAQTRLEAEPGEEAV